MFHQAPDPTEKSLQSVLKDYQTLACSDPATLRLLIPAEAVWRFFVDDKQVKKYGSNWRDYEKREPGYIKAMYAGYQEIFDTQQTLSVDYIQKLHRMTTEKVATTIYSSFTISSAPGGFRLPHEGIRLAIGTATNAGLAEILAYVEEKENTTYIVLHNTARQSYPLTRQAITLLRQVMTQHPEWDDLVFAEYLHDQLNHRWPPEPFRPLLRQIGLTKTPAELLDLLHAVNVYDGPMNKIYLHLCPRKLHGTQEIEQILTTFNDTLQKTPRQKLTAIAELIHALEQLHPFADGNTRVFSMLLANQLFLRAGFPMAIFDNPNRFCCSSVPEIITDFLAGMQHTLARIKMQQFNDNALDGGVAQKETNEMFRAVVMEEEKQHARDWKRQKMGK